jgi:hypothetical protein
MIKSEKVSIVDYNGFGDLLVPDPSSMSGLYNVYFWGKQNHDMTLHHCVYVLKLEGNS